MTSITEKYIFKCKLANMPVCIVADIANGVYADLLEKYGLWERMHNSQYKYRWIVRYPIIIQCGRTRDELEVGDTFTIAID